MKTVTIPLELTEEDASNLALFLSRASWSTYEGLSDPTDKAQPQYFASAVEAAARSLRQAGYSPR